MNISYIVFKLYNRKNEPDLQYTKFLTIWQPFPICHSPCKCDIISSLKGEVWCHRTCLIPSSLLLKCLCKAWQMSGHVCVCYRYRFCFFLLCFDWNLELLRQCVFFLTLWYRYFNRYQLILVVTGLHTSLK